MHRSSRAIILLVVLLVADGVHPDQHVDETAEHNFAPDSQDLREGANLLSRSNAGSQQKDSEVVTRAHIFGQHVFYLAPFQDDALNDVFSAESEDQWRGYTGEQEDGSINVNSRARFENAIANLRDGQLSADQTINIGGRFLGQLPSVWNGPATGGYTISLFGMGFGWKSPDDNECSDFCLQQPDICTPSTCYYMRAKVGESSVEDLRWTSDSAITFALAPGLGTSHNIEVEAGRYRQTAMLPTWFTYDEPVVRRVAPTNSPLSGRNYVTVFGQNYGTFMNTVDARVGNTPCRRPAWTSDSSMTCRSLRRGTGAFYPVQVAVQNFFATEDNRLSGHSLSRAFTYDKPKLTGIAPANGPPSGYTAKITLFGENFGLGPELIDPCPGDSAEVTYLLKPLQNSFCQPGFPRFIFQQELGVGADQRTTSIVWDNIKPYSLALDPIACVLNTYYCDFLNEPIPCQFLKDSCKPLSNETVAIGTKTVTDCGFINKFGDMVQCPERRISGYIKDGVDCTYDFAADDVSITDQLCSATANHPSQCTGCRDGEPYCCNQAGAIGARVRATECITLTWLSSSSMVCKVAPGLGFGHPVMVAIDDFKGGQVDVLENAFTFDAPRISSISRASNPTSGGTTATFLGEMFGTFQCTTRCSFDEDLLRCNSTGCGKPGSPPRSKSVRHAASLKASYDGSDKFRTACQTVAWTSDTAMTCVLSPGTGDLRVVQITVAGTQNLFTPELQAFEEDRAIRYYAPSVTALSNFTLPSTGGAELTVMGHNFGKWDTGPEARLSGTACITTRWLSDSSLTCTAPAGVKSPPCSIVGVTPDNCPTEACRSCMTDTSSIPVGCTTQYDVYPGLGQGVCGSIVVTVDRLRGRLTQVFSYEGGQITAISPNNGPPVGDLNITVFGKNFGSRDEYGFTGQLGSSNCKQITWLSDSAISCSVPRGTSFGHALQIQVAWNRAVYSAPSVQFSFDTPVIDVAQPDFLPTGGDVGITLIGQNFGAHPEFANPNRLLSPLPPRGKIGDTPCYTTQWVSDTIIICIVSGTGIGRGPGVGGNLPLEVAVGGLRGLLTPYGYQPPEVQRASAVNGPATGGNVLNLAGDSFGTYDYSPNTVVGVTDCKLTTWQSNTAVSCVASPCTTFLAGLNLFLPIAVEVGLGHRLDSTQVGVLTAAYTYDDPIRLWFTLNNIEINLLLFAGAVLIAASIVCLMHVKYRQHWRPPAPSLPTRFARTRIADQYKIRPPRSKMIIGNIDAKVDENRGSVASSDSGFYEFEDDGHGDIEESTGKDEAFQKGREAALGLGKKTTSSTPLLGKDIVTGQTVVFEESDEQRENAAGVGFVHSSVESVKTPMPRQHMRMHHARHGHSPEKETGN